MKKLLVLFVLIAGFAFAQKATFRLVVKDSGNVQAADVVVKTDNEVLLALEEWRVSDVNIVTPAVAEVRNEQGKVVTPARPAVYRYKDLGEVFQNGVIGPFIRSITGDKLAAIKAEQAKIEAARAKIAELKEGVTQ